MDRTEKNRQFILHFFDALNQAEEKAGILSAYISDPELLELFLFIETIVPRYTILVDEIVAESQRVIAKARFVPVSAADSEERKKVEIPFAMGYHIKNDKIISHWVIADQLAILEQARLEKMT